MPPRGGLGPPSTSAARAARGSTQPRGVGTLYLVETLGGALMETFDDRWGPVGSLGRVIPLHGHDFAMDEAIRIEGYRAPTMAGSMFWFWVMSARRLLRSEGFGCPERATAVATQRAGEVPTRRRNASVKWL
jgi:hypothetical protein